MFAKWIDLLRRLGGGPTGRSLDAIAICCYLALLVVVFKAFTITFSYAHRQTLFAFLLLCAIFVAIFLRYFLFAYNAKTQRTHFTIAMIVGILCGTVGISAEMMPARDATVMYFFTAYPEPIGNVISGIGATLIGYSLTGKFLNKKSQAPP